MAEGIITRLLSALPYPFDKFRLNDKTPLTVYKCNLKVSFVFSSFL